jgi:uncharacterized membrane protein HdeD (DUF308 family)
MRYVVKSLILIWGTVSVISFCGLVYVFPFYSIDRAFSEALRAQPSSQMSFWFYWLMTFFVVGLCMTLWLYLTYRKQYGRLWKSH